MHPAAERPATPVLVVAETVGLPRAGDPQPDGDGLRYQVVVPRTGRPQAGNVGALIGLSTVLFGFLAAMAFGVVGGVAVATAGTLGHVIARFVYVRRHCPITPGDAG